MWHMTCDLWHVTHDMWLVTCDTWHATHDIWRVEGGDSSLKISAPNEWMNYKGVAPTISISPGTSTEVVEECRILGTIVRSDMKTISNTKNICKKAYARMWLLRRLKALGCPIPELLDVLTQQIITICEGNVAYWGPMITREESNMLERCLKTGLHIIYQDRYINFKQALKLANISSLKYRRVKLISSFAQKAFRNDKFKNWFCESEVRETGARTRGNPIPRLKPVTCRTKRYEHSSLPLMTKLLCWHPPLRFPALDLAWPYFYYHM